MEADGVKKRLSIPIGYIGYIVLDIFHFLVSLFKRKKKKKRLLSLSLQKCTHTIPFAKDSLLAEHNRICH